MSSRTPNWKSNNKVAAGRGATVQQFFATVGADKLEIEVSPWGEGQLKVNGRELELTTDELIARAQKVEAADDYIKQAAQLYKSAKEPAPEPRNSAVPSLADSWRT